tara:strand:- start:346 stop:552 length:207 start_codon:yes stop_codon:yes gene_type:complete
MPCLIISAFPAFLPFGFAEEQTKLWSELGAGNHFVILRHALAPGMADLPGFDLKDCRTQRNLANQGRT